MSMLRSYHYVFFLFLILPWLTPVSAGPITSIQNSSKYTYVLTKATLSNAQCSPSCTIGSKLIPGAVQAYLLKSSTAQIAFEYDVVDTTGVIGKIALLAKPLGVQLTNGQGAVVTPGISSAAVNYTPPVPFWKGRFTSATDWKLNNWLLSTKLNSWGPGNIKVMTTLDSPKKTYYLRIKYPLGSANSGSSPPLPLGGTQFYGGMITSAKSITLSYWLRFPLDFPFTGGARGATLGKLPGLYSGTGNTGDNMPTGYDGWSTRFMWCSYSQELRKAVVAGGELVQFTYQSDQGLYGSSKGKFIGCGTWKFAPDNKWHNLQQTVYLNDPGKANGRIDVCYDGKLVYTANNVMFRLASTSRVNGILFQSFFGGSGKEYATPKSTYADFADFTLYEYPDNAPRGLCVTNP